MHLFYAPDLELGSVAVLPPEESHHAIRVLRLRSGSGLTVVDGKGGWFSARILDPNPRACQVELLECQPGTGQPGYTLHLAIAPTKQIDRIEWLVEKATEIGITEITPLLCHHSERREVKTERLLKVAVSAMKQSLKAWHPAINPMVRFDRFLDASRGDSGFIAHCQAGEKKWLDRPLFGKDPIVILIGPEGDFSEAEIQLARESGFREITLGNSRLRTETAGIVAVQTVAWLMR